MQLAIRTDIYILPHILYIRYYIRHCALSICNCQAPYKDRVALQEQDTAVNENRNTPNIRQNY